MELIKFNKRYYQINDSPVFLLSGEFHYFRVPKQDWRKRMMLFKEAGCNCLATYIPWLLHEPIEGKFCFGETPDWLDLEGFLKTALQMDLYVIARPGAYQYSELVCDGLPAWLCENYPQILARDFHGRIFRKSSVSYVHPLFLEKLAHWFDVICPIIERYTITNGGQIAFVQLDNELTGIHRWFGSLDYNMESMGFGKERGRFTNFLADRYIDVKLLNHTYRAEYNSFVDVDPPNPDTEKSIADIRRKRDYFEFYLETVTEYASWLAEKINKYNIKVPLIHNSANPVENSLFLETVGKLGDKLILGSDHYYNLDQNWPQNHPTPQYAVRCFYSLEMLRLMGYPPTVLEMPGGSASNWPPITAHDAQAAYMLNLAYGIKGCNYYIFTGGPNPTGAGATADIYDYGAGIGPDGKIRPLYQVQKKFGRFLIENSWLTGAVRQVDIHLALDFEQTRAANYWVNREIVPFSKPDAWDFCVKGILTTSLCSSLSPEFININNATFIDHLDTPLIVPCSSCMSKNSQNNLVKFLRNGGKVLLTPVLPEFDDDFSPCTILADFLGNPTYSQSGIYQSRPNIDGVINVLGISYEYKNIPESAVVIGSNDLNSQVIAWSVKLPGNGQVIVLGLRWIHAMHEHERMLRKLLFRLGLQLKIDNSNPNVWATLWSQQNIAGVFLINLFTSIMETDVKVQLSTTSPKINLGSHSVDPVSVKWISLL